MLCRVSQDGIRNSWTPIKLRDVLAKMSSDVADNIDSLALGDFFGGSAEDRDGGDDKRRRALHAALYGYTASFDEERGENLSPKDVLDVESLVERYQESFGSTTGMREGFDAIAARLASSFGVQTDSRMEKKRRLDAFDAAGLSLTGELVSVTEPSDDTPPKPAQEDHVLDTEFIAIYW